MKKHIKMMGLLVLVCVLALAFSACGSKSTDYRALFEDAGFDLYGDSSDFDLDNIKDGFMAYREKGDEDENLTYAAFESSKTALEYFEEGVDMMTSTAEDDEDVSFGNAKVGKFQVAVAYDEYLESYMIAAQRDSEIFIFEFYEEDYDSMLKILKEIGISKLPAMEKLA